MVFRPARGRGFEVQRTGEGAFAVSGRGIERLLQRYDIENEDAMAYLEERLRRIGVLGALEAEGFQPGDELEVGGVHVRARPRRSRDRALGAYAERMVIKLGLERRRRGRTASCARRGARADLRRGRRAAARAPAMRSCIVSSGAIARGMRVLGLGQRPSGDRRAAGRERGGAGQAVPGLRRAAARARGDERAGAADDRRSERAHALPERPADAREAARLAARWRWSTRTTRPPPTRSPSATTTSWRRRWRCSTGADCWCC